MAVASKPLDSAALFIAHRALIGVGIGMIVSAKWRRDCASLCARVFSFSTLLQTVYLTEISPSKREFMLRIGKTASVCLQFGIVEAWER